MGGNFVCDEHDTYLLVNGSFSSLLYTWRACKVTDDAMQFIHLYFAFFLLDKILCRILQYLVMFQKVIDHLV